MRLRRHPPLLGPQIQDLVESVGQAHLEALPAGVVDRLGPEQAPRRGSWHDPCPLCGKVFRSSDRILPVLLADGTRPYVHVACLRAGKPDSDACRHGITPPRRVHGATGTR